MIVAHVEGLPAGDEVRRPQPASLLAFGSWKRSRGEGNEGLRACALRYGVQLRNARFSAPDGIYGRDTPRLIA